MVDEVVEEVAADMRPARRVMLQPLCPCHPAAPAGDPAPAGDVIDEAEDLFGAGMYDDIDEEHHDDTDGERADDEFEVLESLYVDGFYGGERVYCGPEYSPA